MKQALGIAVLLILGAAIEVTGTALAATKCEIHTKPCIDGRTGQPRVCITTICRDGEDTISIDTIVLHEGSEPSLARPKSPRSTLQPELKVK